MTLAAFLATLDTFHRARPDIEHQKRMLYGHVFGKGRNNPGISMQHGSDVYYEDVPAYVIFHAMLGYVLLGVGAGALVLRLPFKPIRRRRWLHRFFGYVWVLGTIWMPVTAIWCIYTFPGWDIIAFFIFSMFA